MRPGYYRYYRHHHSAAVAAGAIALFAQPKPSSSFAPSTHFEHVSYPACNCARRPRARAPPVRQLDAAPTSAIDVSIIDGPFSREVFASTGCWGRRPVLIKKAFDADTLLSRCDEEKEQDESSMWPSWDDVALLSCDEDGESRLITHRPGDPYSWELQLGPFEDEDVANILGDNADQEVGGEDDDKWTLVVNDVDRFFPSLADWVAQEYAFIPRWRRDDAQISLSDAGGGIGPHVDNYDVFLVQMNGRRTWEVGKRFVSEQEEYDTLIEGIDVRVLSTWEEDRLRGYVKVLELDPGDVLYLPPRIPHCGVALTDGCMTLSVGLRAPSANDMISRLAEMMTSSVAGKSIERVTDEDLLEDTCNGAGGNGNRNANSGEISAMAKDKARYLVKAALEEYIDDDDEWDKIFGQLVTESKRPRINYPAPLVDGDEEELGFWGNPKKAVAAMLEGKGALYQAEGITFGYSILDEAEQGDEMQNDFVVASLFVNGEVWSLGRSNGEKEEADVKLFLQAITSKRRLDWQLFDTGAMAGRSGNSGHEEDEEGGKSSRPLIFLSKQKIDLLEDLVQKGYLYGADD